MRRVFGNCMNGMGSAEQVEYFLNMQPDLAVLPELKQKNIEALSPNCAAWATNNYTNAAPKGLGILAFGETSLEELPFDKEMEIYLPVRVTNSFMNFNLIGVWNFYYACKQGRFKDVHGEGALEWAAIEHYTKSLNGPCIFGGDWNFGPTFSQPSFLRMCNMFKTAGFDSLYHSFFDLPYSYSKHPTFRHNRGNHHHLDHVFATNDVVKKLKKFEVRALEDAVKSDHAPLIIDLS